MLREAMAEALAALSMLGYQAQGDGRHAEFMSWRPSDMIGELLRTRGERNVPRNPTLLAEPAFHTSRLPPAALGCGEQDAARRLPAGAADLPHHLPPPDFRDFKPHRHLRVGDLRNLAPLTENGEIQAGTMSESQELVFREQRGLGSGLIDRGRR